MVMTTNGEINYIKYEVLHYYTDDTDEEVAHTNSHK